MKKIGQYFSVCLNIFAWQTLILTVVNICFGTGVNMNAESIMQIFAVSFVIALLMFITDIITAKVFDIESMHFAGVTYYIVVGVIEVVSVVLLLGGGVFGWFDFVLSDMLIVFCVIFAVYIMVFVSEWLRMKLASMAINKKIKEINGDEKSDND